MATTRRPKVAFTIGFRPKATAYVEALERAGLEVQVFTANDQPALDGFAGLVFGGVSDLPARSTIQGAFCHSVRPPRSILL